MFSSFELSCKTSVLKTGTIEGTTFLWCVKFLHPFIYPLTAKKTADQKCFCCFFKAGLVILSPEWNRILVNRNKKEREKTPLSHLCYCKQSWWRADKALGFWTYFVNESVGGRVLSLERRESKQLLPALYGFPLLVDGKPSQRKSLRSMNVDRNAQVWFVHSKAEI